MKVQKIHFFKKMPFFFICAICVILSLSVFVTYRWFSGGTILYYWDANVPLDIRVSLSAFLYPWSSNRLPGFTGSGWSWLPYWGLFAFFRRFQLSLSSSQFLLYVVLITGSIGNFYLFFKRLVIDVLGISETLKIRIFSLLFGIGYALNLYTFYYAYFMFNPEAFLICLLPLNLLALYSLFPLGGKTIKTGQPIIWFFVFIITQIFMAPGFTSYVFLIQYFLLLGFYFLLYLFFSRNKLFSKKTLLFILIILITGLLHWIWFYGAKLGFNELYESQVSYGSLEDIENVSKNMSLLNLFRLFGGAMMNNNAFVWDKFFLSQSILTIPLFLFSFAVVYLFLQMKRLKTRIIVLFFSAILLVSLFFMKMGNPPFIGFMQWLIKIIPYLTAFRESVQKAGLYFLFSYFVLSGIGMLLIFDSLRTKLYKILFMVLCVVPAFILVCSPFLVFAKKNIRTLDFYYNKNKYTFSSKTIVPPEYYELKKIIEPRCDGKNILVYPRTGLISNAIWDKYGMSYVGQDYLLSLINCTISSAQIINTEAEAARNTPYIFLNNHDIVNFKKYLMVNKFNYLIIQKDSVPYLYTSRPDLHYSMVESLINNDKDFSQIFSNDYFTLYAYIPLGDNKSYGFSLSAYPIYTNAKLTTSNEYLNLYRSMTDVLTPVIIQDNKLYKRYSSLINAYEIQSNCVGCVKVQPSKTQQNIDRGFIEKIKEWIKTVFKKDATLLEDQQMSMSLIQMNNSFSDLLETLAKKDYQSASDYLKQYISLFVEQRSSLDTYKGDFFAMNNKLIEMRNFVIGENDLLTTYLNDNAEEIRKYSYDRIYLADILQKEFIGYANDHIWETDFDHNAYKARLDVPIDGMYSCSVQAENQLEIKEILLNGVPLSKLTDTSSGFTNMSLFLKSGSFPLDITYTNTEISGIRDIGNSNEYIYEFGNLQNGAYTLNFSISSLASKKVIAFMTNAKLQENDLHQIISGAALPERIILTKNFETTEEQKDIKLSFLLDELSHNEYYFYVAALDANTVPLQISNVSLQRTVGESSIIFHCVHNVSATSVQEQPQVEKKNPVMYQVTLPKSSEATFLTFNQTYHPDWKAYVIKNGKREYLEHIKNGYANAWVVEGVQGQTVHIEFARWPQIIRNFIICLALVVLLSVVFIYISYDKKQNH